jgi:hypothetical protein
MFFLSNLTSLIYDYIVRQKLGGTNMTFGYVNQFVVFPPSVYYSLGDWLLPSILELNYTSWDIKTFADDVWREADDALQQAITRQWEANKATTGGHTWQVPEWADAYPEIDWEAGTSPPGGGLDGVGCPLPPFKWDEERRANLRAELDAYFALLYGLERDDLRYILDPQDVYGPDFPGETFRVLKEKEIKKFGEYRTRRLVLAAYDHLRPDWDMESHLAKLKEIWEECQVDLSGKKKPEPDKAREAKKAKLVIKAKEQLGLFNEVTAPTQAVIKEGSKVTIKNHEGSTFHYILLRNAVKGQFTGQYKQIATNSALAEAMLGKKVGEEFEFGGVGYEVVVIT